MRKIITRVVKEGNFFNRKKISKIGVEGAPLHDIIVSQSDDMLACFFDNKAHKYYLYSLVDGGLIASSIHEIDCLSDNYFEMYNNDITKLIICCVNHDTNTYEIVNENYEKKYNYNYERNVLAQYYTEAKKLIITNMDNNEEYEFIFPDLPDLEFEKIIIDIDIDIESRFMINVIFDSDIQYFNFFDINTKKFMFDKFFEGEVWEIKEYNNKLYIITHNSELLDEKGKVLIDSIYDNIDFCGSTPYVILERNSLSGIANLENGKILIPVEYDEIMHNMSEECAIVQKDEKYGLIDLETGEIIFEPKYDEIIYEDNSFKAVLKKITTYVKEKIK